MERLRLYSEMTPDEQMKYLTDLTQFAEQKLPVLEHLGDAWERANYKDMETALQLMTAFQFARDFVDKTLRYGDYAARTRRLRIYFDKIKAEIERGRGMKGSDGHTYAAVPPQTQPVRRGRPASAETIARREAEARAARQQTALFAVQGADQGADQGAAPLPTPAGTADTKQPFIAPMQRDDTEYRLTIAQKRCFLSPELQERSDQIRALRITAETASERAKLLGEQGAKPEVIAPYAEQASDAVESYQAVYRAIDDELATMWYRLQNDSPEWRLKWLQQYGYLKADAKQAPDLGELLHQDLLHDLRKHYKKVIERQPDFEGRMRLLVEQSSPEYIAAQQAEAAKKKEVQAILRYFRRTDKGKSLDTAREKFARLQQLLGKKEAAAYKPLLQKVEDDARAAAKPAAESTGDKS